MKSLIILASLLLTHLAFADVSGTYKGNLSEVKIENLSGKIRATVLVPRLGWSVKLEKALGNGRGTMKMNTQSDCINCAVRREGFISVEIDNKGSVSVYLAEDTPLAAVHTILTNKNDKECQEKAIDELAGFSGEAYNDFDLGWRCSLTYLDSVKKVN